VDWQLETNVSGQPIGLKASVTTNLHYLKSQKSEDLIYATAEALNHVTNDWLITTTGNDTYL
jgi:hypothetical protein